MSLQRQNRLVTRFALMLLITLLLVHCRGQEVDTPGLAATSPSTPTAGASVHSSAAAGLLSETESRVVRETPTIALTAFPRQQTEGDFAKFELGSPAAAASDIPATVTSPAAIPTPAWTATPTTVSLTPTPVPVIVTVETIDDVDRTCPNPSPEKPEYYHYYLSANTWPSPDPEVGEHFWLSKPFAGGGRLLITDWFPYGYDAGGRYLIHNGIDMAEPMGTPLLAAADGTVVVAGSDFDELYGWRCDWYGHLVVIELDDRWLDAPVYILYGHVQNIAVVVGQRVSTGQVVAEVGVGGAASLPHLHFEVRVGENTFRGTRNPLLWLTPPATRGVVAGRLVDPEGHPWQGVPISLHAYSEEGEDYTGWSYLGDPEPLLNPDEFYAENFIIGDVEPGLYDIVVSLQGITYSTAIEVGPARVTTVVIETGHFLTSTPTPTDDGS